MVVIVDLDDDVHNPHADPYAALRFQDLRQARLETLPGQRKAKAPAGDSGGQAEGGEEDEAEPHQDDDRPNPNVENGFSAALSCYPIVSQLARMLDLNSLHDLALTCRQFRANLLQYRKQLIAQSLRCSNEDKPIQGLASDRFRESHAVWDTASAGSYGGRLTSGKIGDCARDMVDECRKCGTVVCRNCTIKPPPNPTLAGRHRRLCQTCTKAPIGKHTTWKTLTPKPPSPIGSPAHTPLAYPDRESSPLSRVATHESMQDSHLFTADAFTRDPCCCDRHLWLCQSCGYSLRSNDSVYMRGWAWRTRYSTYLGGLGTGIGEGNEGVQCGRGSSCLAARTVEQEVDLPAEEMHRLQAEMEKIEEQGTGRSWRGASWGIQECEGVGGGVRKKWRKLVRVGAVVKEFEDERDARREYLAREKQGERRSWCAWCERVIRGVKDQEIELLMRQGLSLDRRSSSGSEGSSLYLAS